MLWFMYNMLFAVGFALLLPKFIYRMCRRGGYRKHFLQRFAWYDAETTACLRETGRVWIHAVSVGEVNVAFGFMAEIRRRFPGTCFVLTTTTSTGHALAGRRLGADDVLLYVPTDFPWIVRRALDRIRPRALLLTECELWPNLIRHARARHVPVVLINGRISESSFRGYRFLRAFFGRILRSMNLMLMQGEGDVRRLVEVGADPERVRLAGSAKYDLAPPADSLGAVAQGVLREIGWSPSDRIWVAGSTWPGEETILVNVLASVRERWPGLRLILVPRHAERRAEVESELRQKGVRYAMRSRLSGGQPGGVPDVLVVDSTGELMSFYSVASLVFVGKSLTVEGGQNPIEPAQLGKAVIVGPNMQNFVDVMADFREAKAVIEVADEASLRETVLRLLEDDRLRDSYGARARDLVNRKRGATTRSVEALAPILGAADPCLPASR